MSQFGPEIEDGIESQEMDFTPNFEFVRLTIFQFIWDFSDEWVSVGDGFQQMREENRSDSKGRNFSYL